MSKLTKIAKQDMQTREYKISAPEYQLNTLEELFNAINLSTSWGTSINIEVFVDGDGAASIAIQRAGKDKSKLTDSERVKTRVQDDSGVVKFCID